jgi:hypothetical protein
VLTQNCCYFVAARHSYRQQCYQPYSSLLLRFLAVEGCLPEIGRDCTAVNEAFSWYKRC